MNIHFLKNTKKIVFPAFFRFLICCIAFGQYQVLAVYLNLFQSTYHFLWDKDNLVNNHLHNHLLDQKQFLKCLRMFLYPFFLGQKGFFHQSLPWSLYLYIGKEISSMSCSNDIIFKW